MRFGVFHVEITARVDSSSSLRVGQVHFLSSRMVSEYSFWIAVTGFVITRPRASYLLFKKEWQERQGSNL